MLYVLVVIYNRTCGESIACRCLKEQNDGDFRVLVYDNSDSDLGITTQCIENGWTYLGGKGNRGLPAAYNSAVDFLNSEKAEGNICLLDDDTGFDSSFISDVRSAALTSGADIMLPVLTRESRILSPWRSEGGKHFRTYTECAAAPQKDILAFNSGMIISLDVFKDYRYDENLFLDCVDISFLTEMKKRGKKIAVLPINCEQSFSGAERPPKEKAMKRFAVYLKDMRTYYGYNDLKCRYTLLKRAAHLALVYGTVKPFAVLFGNNKDRK